MKISNKLKALVVAMTMVFGSFATVLPTFALVTCGADTLRPNATVSTRAECNVPEDPNGGLMKQLTTIINVVIGIVGFIAVVVIILGGISYSTSTGDSAKVKKAKDTIMYGIIGLVIALLAFAIVNFVLTSVFPATPAA